MDAIEKRARELLAQAFRKHGMDDAAEQLDHILDLFESGTLRASVDAIIAALTPPEGWVLMPRVLTEEMLHAGYPADNAQVGYEAMLAARPEVP